MVRRRKRAEVKTKAVPLESQEMNEAYVKAELPIPSSPLASANMVISASLNMTSGNI